MHHILAEIIQGGLVLETNVEEIDVSGMFLDVFPFSLIRPNNFIYHYNFCSSVQEAARARKDSFVSSNLLSLGGGGLGSRSGNMKTPLGWLTGKLTGVGSR